MMSRTKRESRPAKWLPNIALRRLRLAKGLSQQKLADIAHSSQSVVARAESGHRQTTPDLAARLAVPLGVDPRELFPRPAQSGRDDSPYGYDPALLRRALVVARRVSGGDEQIEIAVVGLTYALLVRVRDGHPISDDEGTLEIVDDFVRTLRQRPP